jgi:hypothetical protein
MKYLFLTAKIFLYKQDHGDFSLWASSQQDGSLFLYPKILNERDTKHSMYYYLKYYKHGTPSQEHMHKIIGTL